MVRGSQLLILQVFELYLLTVCDRDFYLVRGFMWCLYCESFQTLPFTEFLAQTFEDALLSFQE